MISIKEYVQQEKMKLRDRSATLGITPKLGIIDGTNKDDSANQLYIKNKVKDFNELGWEAKVYRVCDGWQLPDDVGSIQMLEPKEKVPFAIRQAIKDKCTSVIVQLPLREGIIFNPTMIPVELDCDGFHPMSRVKPATPQGIMDYLDAIQFPFEDTLAVVVGRSNIVGRPMAKMLLDRNATVAVIHTKTHENDRKQLLFDANLVVVATGHRGAVTRFDCPSAFVVDVGINVNEEGKLCGDFIENKDDIFTPLCDDYPVGCTPVPGGVGLLTRLALLKNCLTLAELQEC